MLKLALLLSSGIFFAELAFSDSEDRSPARIQALIADLGNDVFIVRERAEAQLLRIGLDAFPELKQATKSEDIEVAQRAGRLLSQFELIHRGKESESVRYLVDLYAQTANVAQKAQILWILASPTEYPDGEGLRTLCRVARFDQEHALRAEAVKCLIASPPLAFSKRKEWFQTLHTVFDDRNNDELLRLVSDYAGLCIVLDALREEAEKRADALEKETGTPIEYPVPFTAPDELRDRVEDFTDRLAAFQSKPENNAVQSGNRYDILLFHALAELQDGVGLTAERDRTLEAALAVRTETLRSDNLLLPIDPLEESSFEEHFQAAVQLEHRYRLQWSERHFLLVAAEAPVITQFRAYNVLRFNKLLRAQYREAAEYYQRCIELLESEEFRAKRNNTAIDTWLRESRAGLDFCLAKIEADAGNWQQAREAVDRSLQNNRTECDAVILRYEISRHLDNLDENYHRETKNLIEGVLNHTEQKFQNRDSNMTAATLCNQAAWLLANTDGDHRIAMALIRIAVRAEPESPPYLDTLAHVHVLGKDYQKAVEVQKEAVRFAPEATALQLALQRMRAEERDSRNK